RADGGGANGATRASGGMDGGKANSTHDAGQASSGHDAGKPSSAEDAGSKQPSSAPGASRDAAAVADGSAAAGEPGLPVEDDRVLLQAPVLAVDRGAARSVCFAVDVPEDVDVTSYTSNEPALLHHVLLARALTREPDGLADCNVLYRTRWQALFMASKGHT